MTAEIAAQQEVVAAHAVVLTAAYAQHLERFVRGPTVLPKLPTVVLINKSADTQEGATH